MQQSLDNEDVSVKSVDWSTEAAFALPPKATVGIDDQPFWSAFQRNTYAARVEFDDGYSVVVCCPDGGARHGTARWYEEAVAIARQARERGTHVIEIEG
jgi:hypothetical protein